MVVGDSNDLREEVVEACRNSVRVFVIVQVCLQIEEENPTLAQVGKYLSVDRPLYAATSAIQQFELLLQTFGGPNETARWHVWKPKITAVGACDRDNMPRIADLNGSSTMTKVDSWSGRALQTAINLPRCLHRLYNMATSLG